MPLIPRETIAESGLNATYTAADVGGDTFDNDGDTFLHVKNGSGAPITVTVTPVQPTTEKSGFGQLTKPNAETIIAAAGEEFMGRFPTIAFGRVGAISYSGVTSLTVAVLRI